MAQSNILAVTFTLPLSVDSGSFFTFDMGDLLELSLSGNAVGSITSSLMFLINNTKTYQDVVVSNTSGTVSVNVPTGSTYFEFNIQKSTLNASSYLSVAMVKNS